MPQVVYFSHFAGEPYFNMAFDEWMFARAMAEEGSSYLRLYSWGTSAITFGYNQIYEKAVNHARLGRTPLIRRPTGGRALYHDRSELTYSIALNIGGPDSGFDPRRISKISVAVAAALVAFLKSLGIDAHYESRSSAANANPDFFNKAPCFASRARYEIVSGDQKVVASAQRRIDQTIFQHGSIKIGGVASHPALVLTGHAGGAGKVYQPLTEPSFRRMKRSFAETFESFWPGEMVALELTAEQKKELRSRVSYVTKNCCQRRDIFKQK
jgi:lipoate-protein ligase A